MNLDLNTMVQTVTDLVATWGMRVIGALAFLIVGRMVARSLRRVVRRAMETAGADPTLVPFVSGLVYWLAIASILVAVLGMVGIQTASLIAVLGAAGLAVGLALQGTLANFAAGVMLLVFRPFKVGDFIEAGGTSGSVRAIGLFATTLNTPDNVKIIVPNSSVNGATIKNYAANSTRRNDLVFGISYDDDIGLAIKTIQSLLEADARVLNEPSAIVAVSELADSSVNLVVRPWCRREDYWDLRFYLLRTVKERLEAAGCSIPYPQQDVHMFGEAAAPNAA